MPKIQLDAYLFFKEGKCKEAMEFYKTVFGGELTISNYSDMPGMEVENAENLVMHADLKGGLVGLMASDSTTESKFGRSAVSISLSGNDDAEAELKEVFEKLSHGGKVDQPLESAPWGAIFGAVTDQFGIEWMINIDMKKE